MADEKENPASAAAQMPRVRRRAPTIELKATEIAVEPPPSAATEEPPAQADSAVPPDYPTEPPAYETGGTEPPGEPPDEPPQPAPRANWHRFLGRRAFEAGLAGGLVALIVCALLALAGLFSRTDHPSDQRLAQIEAQLREIASRPAPRAPDTRSIEERLTRLENAPQPASRNDSATGGNVDEAIKSVQTAFADLARRADDNATATREARGQADAALTAADAAKAAAEKNNVEALANRVAALERASKTLGDEVAKSLTAAGGDRPLRAVVAAQALRAAVERGDAFAAELAAAKALAPGAPALAPLEPFAANGLPSGATMARQLSDLAPAMLKAVDAPAPQGGFLDRLQANAEKLVRIRPVGEAPGGDPAAVISRAQAKAARSDLAGAVAELNALPANVRAPAEDWIKKAEARNAAVNASRRFVADALAALGKAAP